MKLADVAIQTDPGDTVAYCIAVWAVGTNGYVYYRDSVHAAHPTVSATFLINLRVLYGFGMFWKVIELIILFSWT